jgi:FlaA1/EpsC-like NDP-sugar epimerase
MKNILITGAGWLANRLIKYYYDKYDITVLLRDEGRMWKLKINWENVNYIFHDLQFPIEKDHGKFDIIIHTAAMKDITTELLNSDLVFRCNVDGTNNLCNWIMEYTQKAKLIYCGTDKSINPITKYGLSKLKAEEIIKNKKGLNYSIVRMGNLWGSYNSLVQLLIRKTFWKDNNFDLSHIDSERYFLTWQDAVELIDSAISGNEKYYVGNYKSIKIKHLIELLFPDWKINIIGLRPGEKIKEEFDKDMKSLYYSDEEIIKMWNDSVTEEMGDMLS